MNDLVFLMLKKLYNGNTGHREFFLKNCLLFLLPNIWQSYNKHLVDTEYEV